MFLVVKLRVGGCLAFLVLTIEVQAPAAREPGSESSRSSITAAEEHILIKETYSSKSDEAFSSSSSFSWRVWPRPGPQTGVRLFVDSGSQKEMTRQNTYLSERTGCRRRSFLASSGKRRLTRSPSGKMRLMRTSDDQARPCAQRARSANRLWRPLISYFRHPPAAMTRSSRAAASGRPRQRLERAMVMAS